MRFFGVLRSFVFVLVVFYLIWYFFVIFFIIFSFSLLGGFKVESFLISCK